MAKDNTLTVVSGFNALIMIAMSGMYIYKKTTVFVDMQVRDKK